MKEGLVAAAADLARGTISFGGRRIVFHCNHYNTFLQRTIEDGLGERAGDLLLRSGMEASRLLLSGVEAESPSETPLALLSRAAEIFSDQGFGKLDVSRLGVLGGEAIVRHSHYAVGWLGRWGKRKTPCCFYPAGYIGGAIAVAGKFAPERISVRETACLAAGAEQCTFVVEVW